MVSFLKFSDRYGRDYAVVVNADALGRCVQAVFIKLTSTPSFSPSAFAKSISYLSGWFRLAKSSKEVADLGADCECALMHKLTPDISMAVAGSSFASAAFSVTSRAYCFRKAESEITIIRIIAAQLS